MIRRFRVQVDGRTYDVELEELTHESETANPHPVQSNPVMERNPAANSVARSRNAAPISRPGQVNSPIPGRVLKVLVEPGDRVAKGNVLMVVESMKIENPILAPTDGQVKEIKVAQGAQVRTGDLLVTFT